MKSLLRLLVGALALAGCLTLAAPFSFAADAKPAQLSDQDRTDIGRIEAYLNAITTFRARFIQVASTGESASGELTIARPGKMRFDYDPPTPSMLLADGTFLIFVDKKLGQATHVPLGSTPVGVLVDQDVKLSGAVTVTGLNRGPGSLRVSLIRTGHADEGSITLVLADHPMELRQWIVLDAQGIETRVTLGDIERDVKVDKKMFEFDNPEQRND